MLLRQILQLEPRRSSRPGRAYQLIREAQEPGKPLHLSTAAAMTGGYQAWSKFSRPNCSKFNRRRHRLVSLAENLPSSGRGSSTCCITSRTGCRVPHCMCSRTAVVLQMKPLPEHTQQLIIRI